MKGIVFTEFLDMVEEGYGYEMVDKLISSSNLESEGIYTSVGTYSHGEMVLLVTNLHKETNIAVPDLLNQFGQYLFETFRTNYPEFFLEVTDAFDFFESIQDYIHVQVLKLYPDAELPEFSTEYRDKKELRLIYTSERKMSDFALGLIEKSIDYFNENASVEMKNIEEDGSKVLFIIRRNNE